MELSRARTPSLIMKQLTCLFVLAMAARVSGNCFPAIFSFGDSSSDTGGNHAAFPLETAAEFPPYGRTYFNTPQWRYSDGRLLIDFLTELYGMRYLDPYFESVTSDFSTGVNFAIAWATARKILDFKTVFPLETQVRHFRLFKKEVAEVLEGTSALLATRGLQVGSNVSDTESRGARHPYKRLYDHLFVGDTASASDETSAHREFKQALEAARRIPLLDYFDAGLYIILVGSTDFSVEISKQQTVVQVQAVLPSMITAISDAVTAIHQEGGKNIIVGGVGPIGCLPALLAVLPHAATDLDNFGCLAPWNTLVRSYNGLLKQELDRLRIQLPTATLVYLDTYQLQHNIIFNDTGNGFSGSLKACCGVPSAYNFHPRIKCGEKGVIEGGVFLESVTCINPANYTIWDGHHYTEAANRYFASQMLSGRYFDPPFSLLPPACTGNPIQ